MHKFRFIGQPQDKYSWVLAEDEVHHLSKVLRLSVGTEVEVMDGNGNWVEGIVESIGKKSAVIKSLKLHGDKLPSQKIHVALGVLDNNAMSQAVAGLNEVGCDFLHVFSQNWHNKRRFNDNMQGRWEATAAQASKQCKRSTIMQISMHESLVSLLGAFNDQHWNRYFFDELSAPAHLDPGRLGYDIDLSTVAVIGSEVGLSDEERNALVANNFKPVSLGGNVLRATTASACAGFLLNALREDAFKMG